MSTASNKPTRPTDTKQPKPAQTPKSKQAPKSEGTTLAQPEASVAIIDEATLQDKIYTIRGQQVMLSTDLAGIYGYEHKRFTEQIRNNIDKFESDFMFVLSKEETRDLRTNFSSANISSMTRTAPYAFTEQGIYMLMTVLRGPLAVQQSKALIRLFKAMKDHLVQEHNPDLEGLVVLSEQTAHNTQAIDRLQENLSSVRDSVSEDIKTLTATTTNTATELAHTNASLAETNARLEKSNVTQAATNNRLEQSIAATNQALKDTNEAVQSIDQKIEASTLTLSTFMASFGKTPFPTEFVILQGETLEARVAFQQLYSQAKHSVIVIDDYLGLNTLLHLRHVPKEVSVYIFSDNKGAGITAQDLAAFQSEYPAVHLELRTTNGVFHDRFIILDHGFENERIFLCGASSKDAGRKVSMLVELSTPELLSPHLFEQLFSNPLLKLK